MFLTTSLCACTILVGILYWCRRKPRIGNALPGPITVPIIGNMLQIGARPHLKFTEWARSYGPIYRIKLGLDDTIIVSDSKLINELLNESASSGRSSWNVITNEFTKGPYGIINSSGSTWEAQRKFGIRTLRSFGFAKTSMESMILDEVQIMLDWFRKQEGSPISGARIFNAPVINSLWRIVTGERCRWEEESRPFIFDAMDDFFHEIMKTTANGLFFAPVLRFIAPNLLRWNQYVKSTNTMMKLFEESIRKHQETFDVTELRDYIDYHLLEIENVTDKNSSFYGDKGIANLKAGLFDLFFAGSETSSSSLSWTLLYLSENQEIQKHLQNEIDMVFGSRFPSLLDRVNMPYSEAVIAEILRITSVVPLGVPHEITSDMIFHGYYLPKGAALFANIYGAHHDIEVWGDPETFRPERFLNEDGNKFVQNEALIPFSEGKRKCIGDTLAKDTLFLFVTSIFQQFDIIPFSHSKQKLDIEPEQGLILAPKPFKVSVSSRKNVND